MARESKKRSTAKTITLPACLAATFLCLGLLLCRTAAEPEEAVEKNSPAKILLVGIDAADWNIIDPLLKDGKLPNLARLIDRGTRARLKTITPTLSPVVWTSIATGMTPYKHGIIDFLATKKSTGELVPVTSNLRKAKAIWNILSDHGISVGVTGWWATWPAEEVNGFMVTDRVAYNLFSFREKEGKSFGKTYPPALYDEIVPLRVKPEEVDDSFLARFLDLSGEMTEKENRLVEEFRAIIAQQLTYHRISLALRERFDPAFDSVYFEGVDTVGHLFMPYRDPKLPWIEESLSKRFHRVVDEFYCWTDEILGEQLATVGPSTRVLVLSDHGFRTGRDRPPSDSRIGYKKAAEWHRKYGILVMAGPGVKGGHRISQASILDVAPIILHLSSLPASEEMDGKILAEAFEEEFFDKSPPALVRTFEEERGAAREEEPIPSPMDRSIKEKLHALGYIGSPAVSEESEGREEKEEPESEEFVLDNPNSINNAASILLNRGETEEAVKMLERLAADHPEFTVSVVPLALAYSLNGDKDKALETYRSALRRDPENPALYNYIGNLLMEKGDQRRAEEAFRKAVEIYPDFTDAHNSLGILHEKRGDFQTAKKEYEVAIEVDPEYAEGYNNIGNLYKEAGDFDTAIEKYEEAIEADPDFYGSYNNLGVVYQLKGEYEEALSYLEKGVELNPADPEVRNNMATLLMRTGRKEEAEVAFEDLIEEFPDYAEAYNNLGVLLGTMGRGEEELRLYREATHVRPDYLDAHLNLALALIKTRNPKEAGKTLDRCLELDPENIRVLENLSILHFQLGEYEESERTLTSLLSLMEEKQLFFPDRRLASLFNLLADTRRRRGNVRGEREALKRSLELVPDQGKIKERLEELESRSR
jgi:Tfp pilus assembly protein PilF/predicted AlkP superfamily phosphohydrolase/phosphomutase